MKITYDGCHEKFKLVTRLRPLTNCLKKQTNKQIEHTLKWKSLYLSFFSLLLSLESAPSCVLCGLPNPNPSLSISIFPTRSTRLRKTLKRVRDRKIDERKRRNNSVRCTLCKSPPRYLSHILPSTSFMEAKNA